MGIDVVDLLGIKHFHRVHVLTEHHDRLPDGSVIWFYEALHVHFRCFRSHRSAAIDRHPGRGVEHRRTQNRNRASDTYRRFQGGVRHNTPTVGARCDIHKTLETATASLAGFGRLLRCW